MSVTLKKPHKSYLWWSLSSTISWYLKLTAIHIDYPSYFASCISTTDPFHRSERERERERDKRRRQRDRERVLPTDAVAVAGERGNHSRHSRSRERESQSLVGVRWREERRSPPATREGKSRRHWRERDRDKGGCRRSLERRRGDGFVGERRGRRRGLLERRGSAGTINELSAFFRESWLFFSPLFSSSNRELKLGKEISFFSRFSILKYNQTREIISFPFLRLQFTVPNTP